MGIFAVSNYGTFTAGAGYTKDWSDPLGSPPAIGFSFEHIIGGAIGSSQTATGTDSNGTRNYSAGIIEFLTPSTGVPNSIMMLGVGT